MVPPVGIIITVSVLLAAGIAAYENPQVRAWIDRTRHKIAIGLHSLGDEIGPRPRPRRTSTDVSMHEDKGDLAEARRRQAIAEIMERGRILEERTKRRKLSDQREPRTPTFDTMVDQHGVLLNPLKDQQSDPPARSSGISTATESANLRSRTGVTGAESARSSSSQTLSEPSPLEDLLQDTSDTVDQSNVFESRYEREMRDAWNIPLSERRIDIPPSHASESLIELTPTTENAPDPDFSVPTAEDLHGPFERSEYFSAAASNSTHTFSDRESQPSLAEQGMHLEIPPGNGSLLHSLNQPPPSSTVSLADSTSNIHASEAEESSDDVLSEIEDGVRTPASTWTDVDSTVSGDFGL